MGLHDLGAEARRPSPLDSRDGLGAEARRPSRESSGLGERRPSREPSGDVGGAWLDKVHNGRGTARAEDAQGTPTQSEAARSEWREVREQLNRAMGQLQSDINQHGARETLKELNAWIKHLRPDLKMKVPAPARRTLASRPRERAQP